MPETRRPRRRLASADHRVCTIGQELGIEQARASHIRLQDFHTILTPLSGNGDPVPGQTVAMDSTWAQLLFGLLAVAGLFVAVLGGGLLLVSTPLHRSVKSTASQRSSISHRR